VEAPVAVAGAAWRLSRAVRTDPARVLNAD
jgi:hypothetical protein